MVVISLSMDLLKILKKYIDIFKEQLSLMPFYFPC